MNVGQYAKSAVILPTNDGILVMTQTIEVKVLMMNEPMAAKKSTIPSSASITDYHHLSTWEVESSSE